MNTLDQTLSQLAVNIPGATAVFHRHQLDFCCGGKQTLRNAAAQRITRGIRDMAVGPVTMMRAEHEDHGEALARLKQLTNDITLPPGACNTWRALYLGLETLVTDLMDHIHLENDILFDRIDNRTGEVQQHG